MNHAVNVFNTVNMAAQWIDSKHHFHAEVQRSVYLHKDAQFCKAILVILNWSGFEFCEKLANSTSFLARSGIA